MILQINPLLSQQFAPPLQETEQFAPPLSTTTTQSVVSPPVGSVEETAIVGRTQPPQDVEEEGERKFFHRTLLGGALEFLGAPSFARIALSATRGPDPLGSLRGGAQVRAGLEELGLEELAKEPTPEDMALVATDMALLKVGGPILRFVSKPFRPLFRGVKKFMRQGLGRITERVVKTEDEQIAKIIRGEIDAPGAAALTPEVEARAVRAGREMTEEEFNDIVAASLEALESNKILRDEFVDNSTERIFRKIGNAIGARAIRPQKVLEVSQRYGLDSNEAAQFTKIAFQQASSLRGRGMKQLSDAAKAIGSKLEEIGAGEASTWARLSHGAQSGLGRAAVRGVIGATVGAGVADDPAEGALIGGSLGAIVFSRRAIRIWRAIVTSQPTTTIRNAEVGGGVTTMRLWTDIVDNSMQALTRIISRGNKGKPLNLAFRDGFEQLSALYRRLGGDRARVNKIIDELPGDVSTNLLGAPITDVTLDNAAYRFLHVLNRTQEFFYRRLRFDARIHQEFRKIGVDPIDFARRGITGLVDDKLALRTAGRQLDDAALADLRTRVQEEVVGKLTTAARRATTDALEITFAAPKGGWLLNVMNKNPELMLGHPFPRFVANSLDFMYKHQATGLARFFSPKTRAAIRAGDESVSGIIAQASGSIPLMAGAFGIRASDRAGARWYEIKVGDRVIDARPFNPLAAYLFVADVVLKAADRNKAGVPLLEAIGQTARKDFNPREWAEAFLGIRGVESTGLVLLDVLQMDNLQSFKSSVERFTEQWLSGYTIDFSAIRDIMGEQGFREVEDAGIFGRALGNLGLGELQPSPTRSTPLGVQEPIDVFGLELTPGQLRQATGVTIRQKNVIEEELDRLDIRGTAFPRTGDDVVERAIKERLGPLVERSLAGVIESPGYQKLNDFQKKEFISDMFSNLKSAVKPAVLAQEAPRIIEELTEKMVKLPSVSEVQEELNRLRQNQTINQVIESAVLANVLRRRRQQKPKQNGRRR